MSIPLFTFGDRVRLRSADSGPTTFDEIYAQLSIWLNGDGSGVPGTGPQFYGQRIIEDPTGALGPTLQSLRNAYKNTFASGFINMEDYPGGDIAGLTDPDLTSAYYSSADIIGLAGIVTNPAEGAEFGTRVSVGALNEYRKGMEFLQYKSTLASVIEAGIGFRPGLSVDFNAHPSEPRVAIYKAGGFFLAARYPVAFKMYWFNSAADAEWIEIASGSIGSIGESQSEIETLDTSFFDPVGIPGQIRRFASTWLPTWPAID